MYEECMYELCVQRHKNGVFNIVRVLHMRVCGRRVGGSENEPHVCVSECPRWWVVRERRFSREGSV